VQGVLCIDLCVLPMPLLRWHVKNLSIRSVVRIFPDDNQHKNVTVLGINQSR
jgi:hypothetical protein